MSRGFACAFCFREGGTALVPDFQDQFNIEVAAKRADSNERARQVSTWALCRKHAVAFIDELARRWNRKHDTPLGPQDSLFDD